MRTSKEMRGTRVIGGKKGTSRIGKITTTVFHPRAPRAVGYMVKRPDFLWMIKRKDKFLALDSVNVVDGRISASKGAESWDDKAAKRLGIDLDKCVIWENMPVMTSAGYAMGYVDMIKFDEVSGKVSSITCGDGLSATAILGSYEIPVRMIMGYDMKNDFILVDAEAREVGASGGLAAKAGTATAKAGQGAKKAVAKTGEAINDGAFALGSAIGNAKRKAAEREAEEEAEEAARIAAEAKAKVAAARAAGVNPAAKPAAAPAPAQKSMSQSAASALGKQLGKSKGMFAAFKDEFEKGKAGE